MNTKTLNVSLLLLAVALVAAPLLAIGPVGEARAAWSIGAAPASVIDAPTTRGRTARLSWRQLDLSVDLTGVTVDGSPAVLGAYVLRVRFDPAAVELRMVRGGTSAEFERTPTTTDTERANARGEVRVVAFQTDIFAPSGLVNVGRLLFVEKTPGGAQTISVTLESVATAIRSIRGDTLDQIKIDIAKDEQ